MRITNSLLNFAFESKENEVYVLVIEKPKLFYQIIEELRQYVLTGESSWIISENNGSKIPVSKIDIIYSPFDIDLNSKKILNKIYKDIDNEINQNLFLNKESTISSILNLFETAIQNLYYYLEYNFECDFKDILKIFNVRIPSECNSLLEKIVEYVKISHEVCGIKCFFFINLKNYLDNNELEMFYKEAFYNKITLILLEFNQGEKICSEHTILIDYDLCLIEF